MHQMIEVSFSVIVNLDAGAETVESSGAKELVECREGSIIEPQVGMEFESERAAKAFYDEYARGEGFLMRLDQCRRSVVDDRILSRRFLCNKQGFYVKGRNGTGPVLKQRSSAREGCKAMLMVKVNKSGKWVVTKFVKDHTHSLGVSARPSSDSVDSKDKKIQELGMELERQDRLCQLYRELLCSILDNVEDQTEKLATKVVAAVNSVREIENEAGKPSDTR